MKNYVVKTPDLKCPREKIIIGMALCSKTYA